jgi:hypothetical protein
VQWLRHTCGPRLRGCVVAGLLLAWILYLIHARVCLLLGGEQQLPSQQWILLQLMLKSGRCMLADWLVIGTRSQPTTPSVSLLNCDSRIVQCTWTGCFAQVLLLQLHMLTTGDGVRSNRTGSA